MFSFQLKRRKASWIELQRLGDQELLPEILAGDHDAFAVVVDRYQRLVFSVALRIVKNPAEAEDVVQNVFADIFRKAAQFDPSRGTLKVWILQYAYSRAINHRHWLEQRHFYSQTGVDEINPLGFAAGFTRSEDLSTPEASRLVGQAIRSLKPFQPRQRTSERSACCALAMHVSQQELHAELWPMRQILHLAQGSMSPATCS